MPRGTEFIRALEHHRAVMLSRRRPVPDPLSKRLVMSWIHHDNMLEGRLYRVPEIVQALNGDDHELDRYLHPLMAGIRRYQNAIDLVWTRAHKGCSAVTLDTLKRIHRMITPAPKDRGGLYRKTSPVHRDYYQRICPADKVPYNLRKLFELVDECCDEACDPVAFAAEFHHRLMGIYPFRRNPGTACRLFTNLLLLSRGYPPAIILAHQRDAYYDALAHPDSSRLAKIFRDAVELLLERAGGHQGLIQSVT